MPGRSLLLFLALTGCVDPAASDEAAVDMPAAMGRPAATLAGGGARFLGRDGSLLVEARFAAWGREGATSAPGIGVPAGEGCAPRDADAATCLPAHRWTHAEGVMSWWAAAPGGHEQGWTVAAPPAGAGLLHFDTELDGAAGLATDGATAHFTDAEGRVWTVGGLAAWDADGAELPVWAEVADATLRVVVDDASAAYPITIDPIYSSPDVSITGTVANLSLGNVVRGIGDVNGDGYDDVAAAGYYYADGSGWVYVYHGGASGPDSTPDASYIGPANSWLGWATDGGDINADGYADLVVGGAWTGGGYGMVSVYSGSTAGLSSSGATMSSSTRQWYGNAVAVGDYNGDGYGDVAVCAYGYSSSTGRGYIYYGSAAGLSTSVGTTLAGIASSSFCYAADAADVNGDGYDDLAVGAPIVSSGVGRVYVYHGSASGLSSSASTTLAGAAGATNVGLGVANAGDLNGDGYEDLVVSTNGYTYAFVFHGSATGVDSTIAAQVAGQQDVGGLGDIDGDTYDDIFVGTYTYGGRIYSGSGAGVSTTAATTFLTSDASYGQTGDGAGDVNGDGINDVVIGQSSLSTYDTTTGSSTRYGGLHVFFGYMVDDDGDGVSDAIDCDATDPAVGAPPDWYADVDGDGYGDPDNAQSACASPGAGYTSDGADCDDGDAAINPAGSEVCDAADVDEDCDGASDDADASVDTATWLTFHPDADGDGYGDGASTVGACDASATALDDASDCDDADPWVNPDVGEEPTDFDLDGVVDNAIGDGVDQNCDGREMCFYDGDGDGDGEPWNWFEGSDMDCADAAESSTDGDCDDGNPSRSSLRAETVGDGADNDCDGYERCYVDADRDSDGDDGGATVSSSDADCSDRGEARTAADCDDTVATIYGGAAETIDDGVDQDCDGGDACHADLDGDAYGGAEVASADLDCADAGEAGTGGDCDDGDATVSPAAVEVAGDEVDQDCDDRELCYQDVDRDGHGSTTTRLGSDADCADPAESTTADDCDDGDAGVSPTRAEAVADGTDNDCDGFESCFVDADGDGYGDGTAVASADLDCTGAGEAAVDGDCAPTDATVSPGASEIAADGVDGDCDGTERCPVDADGDGQGGALTRESPDLLCTTAPESPYATDCDDGDASVYAGAPEGEDDGVDSDCDGAEDCPADGDGDGWAHLTAVVDSPALDCTGSGAAHVRGDCDDSRADVNPDAPEVCDAADADEDCDGTVDDADADVDPTTWSEWYGDADGDGYGEGAARATACDAPAGYVAEGTDCDDTLAVVHPGATELVADGIDEDCDGGELCFPDTDGDRFGTGGSVASLNVSCEDAGESVSDADCDDEDAAVFPGAPETCNAADDNCDGEVDEDLEACEPDDGAGTGCRCGTGDPAAGAVPLALVFLAFARRRRATR